ncbi:MAG TPA: phospho-N-acetylmuramoyl-pentapeptide-transferase [Saprospiraceae bacterium]|nr:phospho-N-acetylmuramoyl-pentapeptide-transferase [Saprospiraceae bacterium]MCB9329124.1 phospho-N-acetylmuramoyl-pentapeptide-transferase [Lewinellaceae bacterium]HPK09404.1 phospho-N-acetylmuramoyl-pentapeptide-transferase [Saprospiraceae bacterium]HPQ20472.1 phospho-N-acetylmuramoyl-pentapeptide-transferase [Saprospiraceae bacterium]HRX29846.1 phospho-N-acetylmuramoyl-pentapeptide-transferase [Saprospiraceae bacterium]
MLYYLFDYLNKEFNLPGTGLFQYISFRSAAAIIVALLISFVFGNRIISTLKRLQVGESVRELGLDGQKEKEGTPTMGGFIIILATVIPCLLFARLDNVYILLLLFTTLWMGFIGFLDDYIKVFRRNKDGLKGKFKILGQVVLGLVVACVMLWNNQITIRMPYQDAVNGGYKIVETYTTSDNTNLPLKMAYVKSTMTNVPFFKNNNFDYKYLVSFFWDNADNWVWIVFIPIIIFIVTAVSNAANLTDGIDGLAAGTSAIIGMTLAVFAYVSGNTIMAEYLNIFFLPNSSEMVIFASCFLAACIGFLWYNSYPAQVFMGDTGSLMLGGVIAVMAVLLRKEWLIPLLCGIFLVENLSVVMQVSYFKYTKKKFGEGRRIFKMSPLHHHYQKLGIHEAKIVTRFWIVGIFLAILTVITLKIR